MSDLETAGREWLLPQLDKSYKDYGETKMMELTHFDGYAMLDAIEFGAEWKEQQMMAKAINTEACLTMSVPSIIISLPLGVEVGDKLKVIIIKDE